MTPRQRIEVRQSERRERLNELAGLDKLDDAQTGELDTLTSEYRAGEKQLRAAIIAEDADAASVTATTGGGEDSDRLELRKRCSIGAYLKARLENRAVTGAEAELAAEIGTDGIPLELWAEPETRAGAVETRAVTPAPGTVGVNMDLIRPAIFAPSVVPRLGVEMPRVASGSYAAATITTSVTAGAVAKSGDSPETAGAITVTTTTPHRISARLAVTLEDIAAVGQDNFESVLRENLSLALSAELDNQGLNGAGASNDLTGLIARLTDPTDPSDVASWAAIAGLAADHVDGLFATSEGEVAVVLGVDSYQHAAKSFRGPEEHGTASNTFSDTPGELSALAYLESRAGSVWTNSRMPAAASNVQTGLAHRRGRMGIRTAVCPVWSEVMVDDMYSGSSKGERYVTFHVLLGDVILVQPGAYGRFELKLA